MPKASGPGPRLVTSRPDRQSTLIRERVCQDIKQAVEVAVKPFYPAKIRQKIFFPDRKLVQFDSGKLQTLANLLRQMKAGGHKCLIFTQMSKMLDILEVFLNLHAHTYVRLDGSTGIFLLFFILLLCLLFLTFQIFFSLFLFFLVISFLFLFPPTSSLPPLSVPPHPTPPHPLF